MKNELFPSNMKLTFFSPKMGSKYALQEFKEWRTQQVTIRYRKIVP